MWSCEDIIGRGNLRLEAVGLGADGEKCGREDPLRLRASMGKDGMDVHYWQGLLFSVYHSNVRRGSGVD